MTKPITLLIVAALMCQSAPAAFTASTFWETEVGGDDTNFGGGFDTGVAGFPTDGVVTLATTGSPVLASASYTFVTADVTAGAWVYLKAGTAITPGWYKIASISGNNAVLDAAVGHAFSIAKSGPNTVAGCGTGSGPWTSVTWGIDYSQSTSSRISLDDMIVGGTTTQFTSVHTPVGKNFIGNIISVTSGATVQRVAIVSTSTITATCDKSLGTAAQVGVGQLGGAFGSPGAAASVAVGTNRFYIKAGTYSITSASANISGGVISITCCGNTRWEGYQTYRGDLGTAPVLQASGISTFTLFANSNGFDPKVFNLTFDCNSLTSSRGISIARGQYFYITGKNCTNNAFSAPSGSAFLYKAVATGNSTQPAFLGEMQCVLCEAYSNTVTGFSGSSNSVYLRSLSYNNSGATTDGFGNTGAQALCWNCVSYGNGRDGYRLGASGACINCIAEANTGVGYSDGSSQNVTVINSADYNNTGGRASLAGTNAYDLNPITGTSSFFISAATANFTLNKTVGSGALLFGTGAPSSFPVSVTTEYLDVGASQHTDTAKGSAQP